MPTKGGASTPDAERATLRSLILSGSIGKGHDSVAEACRMAFAALGVQASVLDCMSMLGGAGSRVGTAAFKRMISVPSVYDAFHFSHLRNGTWLPRMFERAALGQVVPAVREQLSRMEDDPVVVSVFPTGVSAAGVLKQEDPSLTTVVVCTDACAHRMWVAPGTDLYIVCSPLAATTIQRYAPGANLAVVPPPVRPPFFEARSKIAAREELGIPSEAPCVLLMAGGWGLGPLAETATRLGEAGYFVLAVAGMNERLHAQLRDAARRCWRVLPFGMTDRVPDLMAAADAVVTSSGQTCHEARVIGRWLVILDVVPGHGRENTLHELEKGAALACSPDPESVVAAVRLIFEEQPEQPPWPVRSAAEWEKHFFAALAQVGIELPGSSSDSSDATGASEDGTGGQRRRAVDELAGLGSRR